MHMTIIVVVRKCSFFLFKSIIILIYFSFWTGLHQKKNALELINFSPTYTFHICSTRMTEPVIMARNQIIQHMGHCPVTKFTAIIPDEEPNDMHQRRRIIRIKEDAEWWPSRKKILVKNL